MFIINNTAMSVDRTLLTHLGIKVRRKSVYNHWVFVSHTMWWWIVLVSNHVNLCLCGWLRQKIMERR